MLSTTAFLALAMQCAPSVHPDTALAVARVGYDLNPYAIGIVGVKKGLFPKSKNQALTHVNQLKTQGKRYSLRLMQITSSNFKTYHVNDERLFDPCTNLAIFEKILTDCYQRGGSLKRALSCYYAGNFSTGQKKEGMFNNTSYIKRIGYKKTPQYVVPSVKQDITDNLWTLTSAAPSLSKRNITRYPRHLLRGDIAAD